MIVDLDRHIVSGQFATLILVAHCKSDEKRGSWRGKAPPNLSINTDVGDHERYRIVWTTTVTMIREAGVGWVQPFQNLINAGVAYQ
ncbi:MAG: hypothetical protein KatS3mg057_2570 [Herpetosiphonaceae bacterium]|nr:MAG: hypothetical protein KatS3mg057_2570 [Herpetosiphonaceae bacterium]